MQQFFKLVYYGRNAWLHLLSIYEPSWCFLYHVHQLLAHHFWPHNILPSFPVPNLCWYSWKHNTEFYCIMFFTPDFLLLEYNFYIFHEICFLKTCCYMKCLKFFLGCCKKFHSFKILQLYKLKNWLFSYCWTVLKHLIWCKILLSRLWLILFTVDAM